MLSLGENKLGELYPLVILRSPFRLVAEELLLLFNSTIRQEGFYQFVKEKVQEIEDLKDLKKGLHELGRTGEVDEGIQENDYKSAGRS